MTEHTVELKQELLANIISTNNLSPEDVKYSWRYDEETDDSWLSLHYPVTVKSTNEVVNKKKSKTNMSIIKQLAKL